MGQAAGQGAVADQRDHVVILAPEGPGAGHAEGDGDRVGSVPGDKSVVDRFTGLGKARNAPVLAEAGKAVAAAGEDLVRIALVPDVKNEPVPRRVVDAVDRQRQFDRTEIGREMSAGFGDALDLKLTELVTEGMELVMIQLFDVIGRLNSL